MLRHGTVAASVLAALVALPIGAHGAIAEHEVFSLPGWDHALPSRQYSGFISAEAGAPTAGHERRLHYILVLAENDPQDAPVVLWTNGGPGCSSLEGYMNEMGPLRPDPDDPDRKRLTRNPYTWQLHANMLYLEHGVGVGFSYSNGGDVQLDDEADARDVHNFLRNFFFPQEGQEGYPELAGNEFFLTAFERLGTIDIYNIDDQACQAGSLMEEEDRQENIVVTAAVFAHEKVLAAKGLHLDSATSVKATAFDAAAMRKELDPEEPSRGLDACGGGSFNVAYFNRVDVQKALNVFDEGPVVTADRTGWEWAECSRAPFFNYTKTTRSHTALYQQHLIPQMRVTIFSGDVDACVPYLGTMRWIDDVVHNTHGIGERKPWPEVGRPWTNWNVDANVAGYFSTWDVTGTDHTFTFATVKGAGHMVPETKPKSAGSLFYRFLHDLPMDFAEKQPVAGNGRLSFDAASGRLRVDVKGGTAPFSFEWYRNNVLIEGAFGSTLALTGTMAAEEAEYHCHIIGALGSTAWSEGTRVGAGSTDTAQLVGNDSCRYAFDGECDDGSKGGAQYCAVGTDASDCAETAVGTVRATRKEIDVTTKSGQASGYGADDPTAPSSALDDMHMYGVVGATAFVAGAAFFAGATWTMRSLRKERAASYGGSDGKSESLLAAQVAL